MTRQEKITKVKGIIRKNRLIASRKKAVEAAGLSWVETYVESGGVGQVFKRGGREYIQLSYAWAATGKRGMYAICVPLS